MQASTCSLVRPTIETCASAARRARCTSHAASERQASSATSRKLRINAGSRSFGSLQGQDHRLTYSRSRVGRERIAKKIIELAKNGELNRDVLYEAVLKEYYQHL